LHSNSDAKKISVKQTNKYQKNLQKISKKMPLAQTSGIFYIKDQILVFLVQRIKP